MTIIEDPELTTLVRTYDRELRSYATRLLRDTAVDADDVLQEVWIRAHEHLRSDRRAANLGAWLRVVTHNCAMDARRRASRCAADPVPEIVAPTSVCDDVQRRHDLRGLLVDLTRLEERQRVALIRLAVDGLSHEQLAAELGVSQQATKSLVLRARRSLQRLARARTAACLDVRAAIEHAHTRGARPSEHVRLHLQHCRGCRMHRRVVRDGLRVILPWPGMKLVLAAVAAMMVSTAAWTVTRDEIVEPWVGPASPSWTLGPGTAFSRHDVAVRPEARTGPVDLMLRCPRGYGLFQIEVGSPHPAVRLQHGEWLTWLGARSKSMRVVPVQGRRLPEAFSVIVTCLTRDRLAGIPPARDARSRAAILRNWSAAGR